MRKLALNFSKSNGLLDGEVSHFLDFIRGLSAILVVMEHLSSRLLVGYGNVEHPNLLLKLIYLLNMLGNPAVIIFFVLSGLFISRSVIHSDFNKSWTWRTYLINRFSRLYVVLIPALIITLILDGIASSYFGFHSYSNIGMNIKSLFGNLFFLQNIFVGTYGSDYPLWSLNYEFWYYILFPLIFIAMLHKQGKVSKVVQLLVIAFIMVTIGIKMDMYFLIWLIGAFILFLPKIKSLTSGFSQIIALFMVLTTMLMHPLVLTGRLFTHKWTSDPFLLNLIIGLSFGFLIYSVMHNSSTFIKVFRNKRLAKFSKLLSSFSFSLYLIHYPILNTAYFWAKKNGFKGLQPNFEGLSMEILTVFLICIIAYYFSKITEGKTRVIRKFLLSKTNTLTQRTNRMMKRQKSVG